MDRWLSGEAIPPKHLDNWQRVAIWIRKHRRLSRIAAALLVSLLVVPIASVVAYFRMAETLQQTIVERDAVEQARLELSKVVSQTAAELNVQTGRLQSQQEEQLRLMSQIQQLQADYEQSQQQCRAADERLHIALRDARISLAENFSLQAQRVKNNLPETSLLLAANALSITQQEGVSPIPIALQQVRDLLAPNDGIELRGHEGPVALLATSSNGRWLASGDHRGKVYLWATTPGSTVDSRKVLDLHWDRVTQLVFTADGRWLISGSADSTVRLCDLKATDPVAVRSVLRSKQGRLVSLAVSDDGRWLAAASTGHVTSDSSVRVWDLHAKDITGSSVDLPDYQGRVQSLAISHDGEWIATGNDDGTVRLWRFSNPSRAIAYATLRVQGMPVRTVGFSPNGRWLISATSSDSGEGNTIRAWNLTATDSANDIVLAEDSDKVEHFVITADGRWLIAANEEPALRAWDLAALDKPQSNRILAGQTCPVQQMVLSADGHWLATAGTDGIVRLWNIGSTGPVATPVTIRATRGQLTGIAFVAKGNWIATSNDQGKIQLWNLRVDDLIRMANARVSR